MVSKTKYLAVITLRMDDNVTSDRSIYKTDRNLQWWSDKISQYYNIGEAMVTEQVMYFICQSQTAPIEMEAELSVAV